MGLKGDLSKLHAMQADSFRESRKLREREQVYCTNCVRAIESAALKLGMDPATLAERCANGEIGTLVQQSCEAHEELCAGVHEVSWCGCPVCETARGVDAALQPFRETK